MGVRYKSIKKREKIFYKMTTFTVKEFEILVEKLRSEWEEKEYERKSKRKGRKNAVGQGHPYFADFETMVFLVIMYMRTNCQNIFLAMLFDINEQTIYDISKKLMPLLQDRFIPSTLFRKKRGRINTMDELIKEYPGIEDVIADGTDIVTRRPKRKQAKNYSGKSKKHSKKSVIVINKKDGVILGKTKLRPGSVHDKRILDEDPIHKKLDKQKDLIKRVDSAWTGEEEENGWIVNQKAKRGHPLTQQQKEANHILSKMRIYVEHAIRRVKIFRRIGEKTSFRLKGKLELAWNAAINLANFKQLLRYPINV